MRVLFSQSGDEYEVERGFTSKSAPYLSMKKNTKIIEGNIKELEKVIEEVIGLDYDGFRNSTFVRQEEMKGLGAERGGVGGPANHRGPAQDHRFCDPSGRAGTSPRMGIAESPQIPPPNCHKPQEWQIPQAPRPPKCYG